MALLVTPALTPATFGSRPQPRLSAGEGVALRPWAPDDAPAVVSAYADPAIRRWHCRSMTPDEAGEWIASWPGRWTSGTGAGWAVERDGDVAGQASLRRIDLHEALAEVSYWVLPAFRGRGIAPRALRALAEWSFSQAGMHRLEVSHSIRNPASCSVAAAAGFPAEGTKRGEVRHQDGWHDMHLHARLSCDPS